MNNQIGSELLNLEKKRLEKVGWRDQESNLRQSG